MFNGARDRYNNRTGYFFKLDQAGELGTPDITIKKLICTTGAGYACSEFPGNRFDVPTTLHLPANNLSTLDMHICARVAHEFMHKLGGNGLGVCPRTILGGSNSDGSREKDYSRVSADDVQLVNIALTKPDRCTGYIFGEEPPNVFRTWSDPLNGLLVGGHQNEMPFPIDQRDQFGDG